METQKDYTENLRVASFSAYLNSTEDNSFLLKLTGVIPDPVSPDETPRLKRTSVRSKTEEGEIEVFGADKYFNMKMDYTYDEAPKALKENSQTRIIKQDNLPKLRTGTGSTPSVSSVASWNSQTALLPNLQRNPSGNKPKKGIGKGFFSAFGCNVPCLDKKSVYVNKDFETDGMIDRKDVARKESFRFANPVIFDGTKDSQLGIPNSGLENWAVVKKQLEEARSSIEVFGSQTAKKGDIATNLERKLSILTWDAIPKSQNVASTIGSGTGPIDDIQSDASSDLFEIETGHSLLAIHVPEDCTYEPSEASVEWSVVTASAADFSIVSDYDERGISRETSPIGRMAKTKNVVRKEGGRGLPGGLLGCKTHKAVSIKETAVRPNEIKAKSMATGKPLGHSGRKEFEFATVAGFK